MSSTNGPTSGRVRRVVIWAVAVLVALLLFATVWVVVRALLARDELLGAVPVANRIGSQTLNGGGDIEADLAELRTRAASAASLTSDPVWRAAELVPALGSNLTAFREASAMIDQLAEEALPPLADLAGTFTIDSLSPTDGVFDLDTFTAAQPMLSEARAALETADRRSAAIETERTIPQIGAAIDQVAELVSETRATVDGIETAANLLPAMLGADGPRSYLLLSLNNAELRATGGLPGAIAVINAEGGRITLGSLTTATALGQFSDPVLELSDSEQVLYGDLLGTYMHDVTYTPDFPRTGALAQAMWLERTGETVDGVLAVDPIALGYILGATGPVDAGSGITLTSDNAVDILLSGVYTTFDTPSDQDAFFAGAIGKIFGAVTVGQADNSALLGALARSTEEGRIHLWSAEPDEQVRIETTGLAGLVPISTDKSTAFGVYFNDATGAKMDYYLSSGIGIASGMCRNDQRPNFDITVKLESRAPADAATSLPRYVTGGGVYDVPPGDISTNVFVYAPAGSVPYSVTVDGQEYAFVAAEDDAHSIAGITVGLAPGQQSEVSMKFVGLAGASDAVVLQHTPMASDVVTSLDNYLDCDDVAPAPIEGEEEQSGALSSGNFNIESKERAQG
jgi:hypothetical protein